MPNWNCLFLLNKACWFWLVLCCLGCSASEPSTAEEHNVDETYLRHVGDIEHDPSMDDARFKTCNGEEGIIQYFNAGHGAVYTGGKPTLLRTFESKYKPLNDKSQNGLIRIRFIVNCEGQAGRFRVMQSDSDFNPIEFDNRIVSQILEITQDIEEWPILRRDITREDYYYYLIFKIVNGTISEILP